jgi:hypothetical protein
VPEALRARRVNRWRRRWWARRHGGRAAAPAMGRPPGHRSTAAPSESTTGSASDGLLCAHATAADHTLVTYMHDRHRMAAAVGVWAITVVVRRRSRAGSVVV